MYARQVHLLPYASSPSKEDWRARTRIYDGEYAGLDPVPPATDARPVARSSRPTGALPLAEDTMSDEQPAPEVAASTSTPPLTSAAIPRAVSAVAPVYLSSRPAARPPQRVGAPASTRNFDNSSAAGASRVPAPRFARAGASDSSSGVGGGGGGRSTPGTSDALSKERDKKREAWGAAYTPAEDSIRNDYSTHYVRTGSRPQNHLRGAEVEQRFAEYPKLAALLKHKHALLSSPTLSIPPTFLVSAPAAALPILQPNRFDVILLSPPPTVTFEELQALDLGRVAATPGFVWLWVGSGVRGNGVGLEKGRELIAAWGYRRCEDIVWLKTNKTNPANDLISDDSNLFKSTIEHCLMGIRGTVRRSNDPWLVHCNVDTDVMVWEGDINDPDLKPPELQSLIENFCLGTRRLHLFGSPHARRRGWLTVGETLKADAPLLPVEGEETKWAAVEYKKEVFDGLFESNGPSGADSPPPAANQVPTLLPFVEELDALRPKSPPPRNGLPSSGGLGRGRGAGLGLTRSTMLPQNQTPPHSYQTPRGGGRGLPPASAAPHQPPSHFPLPFDPQYGYAPSPFLPPPYPASYAYPSPQPGFQPYYPNQHQPQYTQQQPPFYPPPHYQQQQYDQQQQLFAQWFAMGGPQMMGAHLGMGIQGMDPRGMMPPAPPQQGYYQAQAPQLPMPFPPVNEAGGPYAGRGRGREGGGGTQ